MYQKTRLKMLKRYENQTVMEKQEYMQILNYFHHEYTQMLRNFLQRHEIAIKESDCLIDYIVKTRLFMPKYSLYTIPITNAMYNEDVPEDMKYTLLMNSYPTVKNAFNQ